MTILEVKRIIEVLSPIDPNIPKLNIPVYQRKYKWGKKNIQELFNDLLYVCEKKKSESDYEHRLGTIILHEHNGFLDIVDGQQRIITLSILLKCIDNNFENDILTNNRKFTDKITIMNIRENYYTIKSLLEDFNDDQIKELKLVIENNLEFVVITIKEENKDSDSKLGEAFQLFDSQNSRGKELYPHDLLKAYHLREMNTCMSETKMCVENWERIKNEKIDELFNKYLFPVYNWINKELTHDFKTEDIELYKGIKVNYDYSFTRRLLKCGNEYQLNDTFISGKSFFDYVNHYLFLKEVIENEINTNVELQSIREIVNNNEYMSNTGFKYGINLFKCVLICYYDRFAELKPVVVKYLFRWSMQIRCDMYHLGYDTINNYSIGSDNSSYSNHIAMFNYIFKAKSPIEIISQYISDNKGKNQYWKNILHKGAKENE